MFANHPSFIKPDENTVIWRYMDFTKFISLLEKNALFFSTVSLLREMDEHEDTYNEASVIADKQKSFSIHDIGSGMLRNFGKYLAINCWHMNEIESVGMWNVYLKGVFGVAIQSTVKQLDYGLNNDFTRQPIYLGKVNYLAENDVIPEPDGFNGLNAALWKWKNYQYENELRAIAISTSLEELSKHNGIYIPVDLSQLIQKIVISPKAPKWFSELIYSVSSRYNLSEKVTSSWLDTRPARLDNNEFSIEFTCPLCNTKQEIIIEPFIVKDYLHNSTVVFSADRITIQCKNCEKFLLVPVRSQMEYSNTDNTQNAEN